MSLLSHDKYGSHSAALMMTHLIKRSLGGESLTCVGKHAPPIPTMPAERISLTYSEGAGLCPSSSSSEGALVYLPSLSITIQGSRLPGTVILGSTALTVPDTPEKIGAETNASVSAIFCPARTVSPFFTRGEHGAPIC